MRLVMRRCVCGCDVPTKQDSVFISFYIPPHFAPRWVKYLENPLVNELYPRRRSDLARMFWDNAPDELPSLKLTGLQNMAGLCKVCYRQAKHRLGCPVMCACMVFSLDFPLLTVASKRQV